MAYDPRVDDEELLFEPFHLNIMRGRNTKAPRNDRLEELARCVKAIVACEQAPDLLRPGGEVTMAESDRP